MLAIDDFWCSGYQNINCAMFDFKSLSISHPIEQLDHRLFLLVQIKVSEHSEVSELYCSCLEINENVVTSDVTMSNAVLVEKLYCFQHLKEAKIS